MHLASDIDFTHGLIGGTIIGLSAVFFMLFTGKITGISGITEGAVVPFKGNDWNLSYLLGLFVSGLLLIQYRPLSFGDSPSELSALSLLIAGLLTGFGTRLGSGCTSGHGLCGLSRRSPRSLMAVLTFMATGAITAGVTRLPNVKILLQQKDNDISPVVIPSMLASVILTYLAINYKAVEDKINALFHGNVKEHTSMFSSSVSMHIVSFISALVFGLGLGISGMANPERVLRFLDFAGQEGWDPTLMSVLGAGVTMTFIGFHLMKHNEVPVVLETQNKTCAQSLCMGLESPNRKIDWKLLMGAAMFGVGWGWAGMCPGPALVSFSAGIAPLTKFVPSMFAGFYLKDILLP